jgi:hypothetical protein
VRRWAKIGPGRMSDPNHEQEQCTVAARICASTRICEQEEKEREDTALGGQEMMHAALV